MTRKISVIVPAYNAVEFLDASLASVAAQTVPVHEVIVVDDGSTDETLERARRWESVLPVRVLPLAENIGAGLGAGGPRAIGIEQSTGELIALLDADDVWLPDHVEAMLRLHTKSTDLITANHLFWVPGVKLGKTPSAELVPVPRPDLQAIQILSENFVFVSTLFSRELYERAGPMRNIRCEDWDMWIRMVDVGALIKIPDHVTTLYRQSATSVSASNKLLQGEIDLLEYHRVGRTGAELEAVAHALRRRHAKRLVLDGLALADCGDISEARRTWLKAIRVDASLKPYKSRMTGIPLFRALVCVIAPRSMAEARQRRQDDPSVAVGDSRGNPVAGIAAAARRRLRIGR